MSPQVENAIAAALGAGAVWLYFRSAAQQAVGQTIVSGITQLTTEVTSQGARATIAIPQAAHDAIDREVNAALMSHLGITSAQLRQLVADIRTVQRMLP